MTIPDSVSHSTLASLLAAGGKAPASPVIPTLEFGSEGGAPCSLQLVVMCLIQQSRSGVNICQIVTAALFLLHNAQSEFEKWERLAETGDFPFADASPEERHDAAFDMRELSAVMNAITSQLENINRALLVPLIAQRMNEINLPTPRTEEQRTNQLSQLLIDDDLLNDLGINRSDVNRFLSSHL